MKSLASIQNRAILVASLLLPFGIAPLRAHHPAAPALPRPPTVSSTLALNAEWNASRLIDANIQIESNGNPRRVGRHGERGLMQIKAGTWRDMTAHLFGHPLPFDRAFEPDLNRRVGTAYLAFLQKSILPRQTEWRADERALLLAAYNAGPGRLRQSGFDLDRLPLQTRDYVERAAALHDAYLGQRAEAARPHRPAAL